MDGPLAQGFVSLTALRAEGCGIALRAMSIKSALRIYLSVSYGMISILVISRYAAPPYPAAPDFPPSGGQNKTPRNILFVSGSAVSTGYCAPACGGKVVAPATKGGMPQLERSEVGLFSNAPKAVVKVLYKLAPSINLEAPPQPSAAEPLSNLRTLGAIAPSNFRTLTPVRACQPSGIPESTAPIPRAAERLHILLSPS